MSDYAYLAVNSFSSCGDANQLAELAERSKALSPEDRSRLVDMLLESLDQAPFSEVEPTWDEEAERRLAVYERSKVSAIDAELVLAKARASKAMIFRFLAPAPLRQSNSLRYHLSRERNRS